MDQNQILENKIKIAVCGPVDAGKSSLIGVLTSRKLDDGRGSARSKVLKHKHELDSGRTSNITFNNLIYETEKYKKVIFLCVIGCVVESPMINPKYPNILSRNSFPKKASDPAKRP